MASSRNAIYRAFGMDVTSHGGFERPEPSDGINLEVINLGLSRTGTTSMHFALEILGFGPGHQGVVSSPIQEVQELREDLILVLKDLYRYPEQNRAFTALIRDINSDCAGPPDVVAARLLNLTAGYRCANDGPMNGFPQEAIRAYPNAKFILCTRNGGQHSWWYSIDETLGQFFREDWSRKLYRALILPVRMLRHMDDFTQLYKSKIERELGIRWSPDIYSRHNKRVEELIPDKQLLKFSVTEGWGPLCEFLEVPVPDKPFPKTNDAAEMKRIFLGMRLYAASVWLLYIGGFAGIAMIASAPSTARAIYANLRWILRL